MNEVNNLPEQSRADWDASIDELAHQQPLHVHTLILPPGLSPDDPILKQGRVVSETTYMTDHLTFPDHKFFGNIDPRLHSRPEGSRIVLGTDGKVINTKDTLDTGGDTGVESNISDVGSNLSRSNIPSMVSGRPTPQADYTDSNGGPQRSTYRPDLFDPNCQFCIDNGLTQGVTQSATQSHTQHTVHGPTQFQYQYIELPRPASTKVVYTTKEIPSDNGRQTYAYRQPQTYRVGPQQTYKQPQRFMVVPQPTIDLAPSRLDHLTHARRANEQAEKQWYRLANDRNVYGPGTYILNQGHGQGGTQRCTAKAHLWDVDRTIGQPTSYVYFRDPHRDTTLCQESGWQDDWDDQRPGVWARIRGWWGQRGDNNNNTQYAFTHQPRYTQQQYTQPQTQYAQYGERYRQSRAAQNRREWEQQVADLATRQPLEIHTVLLPPGVAWDDPRLADAKIISQETYWTDRPVYPDGEFLGTIKDLPTNPIGDRVVTPK
eukprot:Blabericola_migrator_1__2215@NODE_1610_length_4173_cov_134_062835_g1049_i0_p1_GENE_NODE_1610_length_4173_cov_134_062835_g1049_i0NODE_1610_length_4173_cov_134_062835_g1049_i0_p1_ORF_typecomplete_len487_score91_73_NODE_1610_length_4173_cov_134_062835_g1049_i018983358